MPIAALLAAHWPSRPLAPPARGGSAPAAVCALGVRDGRAGPGRAAGTGAGGRGPGAAGPRREPPGQAWAGAGAGAGPQGGGRCSGASRRRGGPGWGGPRRGPGPCHRAGAAAAGAGLWGPRARVRAAVRPRWGRPWPPSSGRGPGVTSGARSGEGEGAEAEIPRSGPGPGPGEAEPLRWDGRGPGFPAGLPGSRCAAAAVPVPAALAAPASWGRRGTPPPAGRGAPLRGGLGPGLRLPEPLPGRGNLPQGRRWQLGRGAGACAAASVTPRPEETLVPVASAWVSVTKPAGAGWELPLLLQDRRTDLGLLRSSRSSSRSSRPPGPSSPRRLLGGPGPVPVPSTTTGGGGLAGGQGPALASWVPPQWSPVPGGAESMSGGKVRLQHRDPALQPLAPAALPARGLGESRGSSVPRGSSLVQVRSSLRSVTTGARRWLRTPPLPAPAVRLGQRKSIGGNRKAVKRGRAVATAPARDSPAPSPAPGDPSASQRGCGSCWGPLWGGRCGGDEVKQPRPPKRSPRPGGRLCHGGFGPTRGSVPLVP